jgi:hypothetical protein
MKAAVIDALGHLPRFEDFPEPTAGEGELVVNVRAAALHPVVRARASGGKLRERGRRHVHRALVCCGCPAGPVCGQPEPGAGPLSRQDERRAASGPGRGTEPSRPGCHLLV